MNLSDFDLLSLQTKGMRDDPVTIALCATLQPLFEQLNDEVKAVIIYAAVDEMDGALLDELAWQFHLDVYDAYAPIEVKRALIKQSIRVHAHKGTVYAVREALQAAFGRAVVREWFEYGGAPYLFRVDIDASLAGVGEREIAYCERAAIEHKNVRSHLERIRIFLTTYAKLAIGAATATGETTSIYPYIVSDLNFSALLRKLLYHKSAETAYVYPKGDM